VRWPRARGICGVAVKAVFSRLELSSFCDYYKIKEKQQNKEPKSENTG
jgi:hypothetical protein